LVRGNRYGTSVALVALVVLAGCSDLGKLADLPARTDPADVPSVRSETTVPFYSSAVELAATAAREALVAQNLPGLSIAVAVGGKEVWAEGFGWADLSTGSVMTPETRLRVGDLAMPVTSAAVGLLIERGLLDLDAPIQNYVSFPAKPWPITTRQLMAQAAGIRDLDEENELLHGRTCTDDAQRLAVFQSDALTFEPGMDTRRSIFGWVAVGAIVSAVAREPYLDFVTREVFGPLGMTHTGASGDIPPRLVASLYYPAFMRQTRHGLQTTSGDISCVLSGGGRLSTPSDMVRLATGLAEGDLLRDDTVALLQAPFALADGRTTHESLGWRLGEMAAAAGGSPLRTIGREAYAVGGTASLLMLPEAGVVVVVATNVSFADTASVAATIARLFAEAAPGTP
jgi:serine beta-lactamase-like protein LACTB